MPGAHIRRFHVALWAALSGLLWAMAWPGIGGLGAVAFLAWVPLLRAEQLHDERTAGRRRAFVPYVLLAVFVWNAATSWWFFLVSEPLSTRLISGLSPMTVNALLMCVPWFLKRSVRRFGAERFSFVALVIFWLALERIHHGWDLKWPWFTMGNVFATRPHWVQWYEYTGVLGGSLWIWLVNLLLFRIWRARCREHAWAIRSIVAVGAMVLVPIILSIWRAETYEEQGPAVEVVIVQPNIDPYTQKFGGMDPMVQLDSMLHLAEGVLTPATRLVVMPETALQEDATMDLRGTKPELHGLWENDLQRSRSAERIRTFQETYPKVAVLTGMSSAYLFDTGAELPVSARRVQGTDLWYEAYNAALFRPVNGPVEHYHKSKLVAGVEMMPFERVLGRLSALSVDLGGTSGSLGLQEERSVLRDTTSGLAVIPAICYESVFGEHVAAHVRNGGNVIAIMTNDGWWGDSPGPVQHLGFASLRAIETRRSIARSANTGISCWVDQRGVIHDPTAWWEPTAIRASLRLNEERTFFVRHGDLVGRSAIILSILLLLWIMVRWVQHKRSMSVTSDVR